AGSFEEEGYSLGFNCIAGLDEVGRGPLAGPVVAAAVVFPRGLTHPDIRDSKLLTAKKREVLADWIKEHSASWKVGIVGSEEIDRINILRATFLAMTHALKQLRPVPDYLLIDGSHKIPLSSFADKRGRLRSVPEQMAIKKGDRLCYSIAAASIVAKVTRDQMMVEYDSLYPEYGFAQHKGYGCPFHIDALSRYGPSPLHRKSFKPVRENTNSAISNQPSAFSSASELFDP
ncbi:MAG: ribonuclease HII, partial [Candidatus Binatia bacterium]